VYEEKIKMPSQSGNSDKGKQPGHIEKPDIKNIIPYPAQERNGKLCALLKE
jgi:hypothetical protein